MGATISRLCRRFIFNLYIPVSHTNRQRRQNKIGVVVDPLVGMGLENMAKGRHQNSSVASGDVLKRMTPSKQIYVIKTLLQRWALVQITLEDDVIKT